MSNEPVVVLHQRAPWNARLPHTYRQRYAEVDGRYFHVEADSLDAPWFVWEIDRDGGLLGGPDAAFVALAFNLPAIRLAIRLRVAGKTEDEIREVVARAPSAGTGRNHPRNVEWRRRRRS